MTLVTLALAATGAGTASASDGTAAGLEQRAAALPRGVLPQPGEVGFLGNPESLRVINSSATAPPGTSWSTNTLRVDADDVNLNGVYVKGSIDYYGEGLLSIRNSIVLANGSSSAVVLSRSSNGKVDIRDSDIVWPSNVAAPYSSWGNGAVHGDGDMTLVRNDISGTPDGVQQSGGNSVFQQNYIHDLRMTGTYPNNTHNDGLQLYGGPNYRVLYNYIELNGYDGTHQNAAIFLSDDGEDSTSPRVVGNYISGGGYQLRLEQGVTQAGVTDNIFGPVDGGFGHANASPGVTVAKWLRNVDENGRLVTEP